MRQKFFGGWRIEFGEQAERGVTRCSGLAQATQYVDRPIRTAVHELHAGATIEFGARVGEVDDDALVLAFDGGVRRIEEAVQVFRQPVIASRLATRFVHALLHDAPMAFASHHEGMQV